MKEIIVLSTLILLSGFTYAQNDSKKENTSIKYSIKNEGEFDRRNDDKATVILEMKENSPNKTMYHLDLYNRHNKPIVRTTNLDFTRTVSENCSSENVFVDILVDSYIKITVFPGGKLATTFSTNDKTYNFFSFAAGSKNIYVSIIGSFKDANGINYGKGLYKLENNSLVLIQDAPNYNLEAKFKSYQEAINYIKRFPNPSQNKNNGSLQKTDNTSASQSPLKELQSMNSSTLKDTNNLPTSCSHEKGTYNDTGDGNKNVAIRAENQATISENNDDKPKSGSSSSLIKDLDTGDTKSEIPSQNKKNQASSNDIPDFELHVKPPQINAEAQPFIVHFFAPYGVFTPVMELRKPHQGYQYILFDVDVVNPGSDTIFFSVNDFFAKTQDGKEIMVDSLIDLQEYLPTVAAGSSKDGSGINNLSFKVVFEEGETRMIPIVKNIPSIYELISFSNTKGYWPARRFLIAPFNHRMFSFITVVKNGDSSFNVKYKIGNSIKIPIL
jgi:hypothetical protein